MTNNKLIQETFTAIVKVYFEFIHLVSSIQSLVCCLPCKVHLHLDIKETRQSPRKFKYCPVIISHAYKQINNSPKHNSKTPGKRTGPNGSISQICCSFQVSGGGIQSSEMCLVFFMRPIKALQSGSPSNSRARVKMLPMKPSPHSHTSPGRWGAAGERQLFHFCFS